MAIGTADQAGPTRLSARFYHDAMRHLVCVPFSVENLHAMAEELGIKRCWFHASKDHPHYDVPKKRMATIGERSTLVRPRQVLAIIRGETP